MELSEIGKAPVSAESAAGGEVRDDVNFDLLQSEIDKLSNPVSSGVIDWDHVVKLASELLEKKGKDLLAAGYLAVALTETRKLEGLRLGLQVLADLVETYWDSMFPPLARIRARRAAIEWWADRTATVLQAMNASPADADTVAAIIQNVERIDKILREKDPDGPTVSTVKTLIRNIPVQDQPSSNGAAPGVQPAAGRPAAPADVTAISSMDDAVKMMSSLLDSLGGIAGWMLEHEASNPFGYRLSRISSWARIEHPPPETDGKSMIPGPNAQLRNELAALQTSNSPANLVKFAEVQLAEHPFWIDLNRIAAEALAAQGPDFAPAANAIAAETAGFSLRMAKLETAAFADGTLFADNATRNWIRTIAAARGGDASAQGGAASDGVEKAMKHVEELAHQGRIIDAAGELQQAIRSTASGRNRLLVRIRFCEVLLARSAVADLSPYLTTLLDDLERHGLESFDSEVALMALSVVYRSIEGDAKSSDDRIDRTALLKRIAAIDYQEALKLSAK